MPGANLSAECFKACYIPSCILYLARQATWPLGPVIIVPVTYLTDIASDIATILILCDQDPSLVCSGDAQVTSRETIQGSLPEGDIFKKLCQEFY